MDSSDDQKAALKYFADLGVKADSGLSDLLPLMMMSGGMGQGMNSMLPLLLMNDGGDNKDMLTMMMMMGQGGMAM